MKLAPLVAVFVLGVMPTVAAADVDEYSAAVGDIALNTVDRVRRGVAIGPQVGGFVGVDLDGGALVDGVSFGVGLYRFDVPTVLELREWVIAAVKRRVKERVAATVAGGGAEPDDLSQIIDEVAAEVQSELLAAPRRRTLERPVFGVVLEGAILTSAGGGFQTRLVVSKGVSRASVGLALGVQRAGGETRFLPGLELSVRLTPIGVRRTPVIELVARGDLTVGSGYPVALLAGGRFTLDLL